MLTGVLLIADRTVRRSTPSRIHRGFASPVLMVSKRIAITHYAEESPKLKLGAIWIDLLIFGTKRLIALANAMVIALMVIILIERGFAIGDGIACISLVGS